MAFSTQTSNGHQPLRNHVKAEKLYFDLGAQGYFMAWVRWLAVNNVVNVGAGIQET